MSRLLLFICCFTFLPGFAQKAPDLRKFKNQKDKLNAWAVYCDEFVSAEEYAHLKEAGRKGISMTAKTDYVNLSLFYFYTGIAFDYGVETDSAAFFLEKSETYGRKAGNAKRVFEALSQLNYVYASYGESSKRKRVIHEFRQILDTLSDKKSAGEVYKIMGDYYVNAGEYEKGLSNLLAAVKIRRKFLPKATENDSINFGVQLIGVAELYIGLKNYDLAINYLKESQPYIRDYKVAIAHVHKDFIDSYVLKNELEKAGREYKKLVRFLEKETNTNCWSMLIESDLIFSKHYREHGDFKKSMYYADHARELAPRFADDFLLAQIDYTTGAIYLEMKDYKKALLYLKAAEPTTSEDDPEVNSWLKGSLANTYAGLGKWQLAYQYQHDYSRLQDTLLTEKSKKNVAEMEARYQNEKKQLEINQLSARNTINNLKIKNASRQRIYFLLVIAAVLVIVGLLLIQSRNRKKHNRQLQTLNEELAQANRIKAQFFSILNHDLRSPVSNLIHFLHLQKNSPELLDENSRQRLENKTIAGAENLLISMEDMLLWSKGQMENFRPVAEKLAIEAIFATLSGHFEAEEQIDLQLSIQPGLHLFTDPNYLQTILRNLTGNAINVLKNTHNPIIRWTASQQNDRVVLAISDNGPGSAPAQFKALFDETEVVGIRTGLGLHLIRDLAKAIDCTITVDSTQEGTTISLRFPVVR